MIENEECLQQMTLRRIFRSLFFWYSMYNFFKFLLGKFSNWIQLSKKWETIKRRDTLHNKKKNITPDTQRTFNLNNAPKPTDSNSNVQKPTQRTVATYGSSVWVCVDLPFETYTPYMIHMRRVRPRARARMFLFFQFAHSFIYILNRNGVARSL